MAKRVPAAKPGRGKAAMYIAGTAPTPSLSENLSGADGKSVTGGPMKPRIGTGAMSVRFDGRVDGRDETPENGPSVSLSL